MVSKKYIEVSLSQVGVNEDSGILQEWLVEEGQFISVGTIICEFETTKTVIEIEVENEGYIVPIVAESAEVKVGDTIAVIVADKKNIKAAKFFHDNLNYYAIAYDQGFGDDYFDENGNSLRKTFLRSPLKFYRISSKFRKKRYHPVLKRYRDHLGTDYAAPRGTPIMSVADGIIKEVRWGKNNGRFVKISHNNIYSTQYLHMSKFEKGIKKGKKILQGEVIGYVGSTGLATGPHVCFRFWRNGNQVDPYKQKDLPEGEPISPKHLNSFLYVKDKYIVSLSD